MSNPKSCSKDGSEIHAARFHFLNALYGLVAEYVACGCDKCVAEAVRLGRFSA